jgi:hypothetical protein
MEASRALQCRKPLPVPGGTEHPTPRFLYPPVPAFRRTEAGKNIDLVKRRHHVLETQLGSSQNLRQRQASGNYLDGLCAARKAKWFPRVLLKIHGFPHESCKKPCYEAVNGLGRNVIKPYFLHILQSFSLEPPRGFEPRTYALRVRCSTPELRRRSL